MFNIERYNLLKSQIPSDVTIIAVSKTKPIEDLQEAYEIGVRDFGENYVQELVEKHEKLPKDIRWHFIGHLQSNKVKFIVPFVELIHGVDSEKLLTEINKQGKKINRKINCLLQVYIAKEETKFGMDEEELQQVIAVLPELEFVNICGLMGMASFIDNEQIIKSEFTYLKKLFQTTNTELQTPNHKQQTINNETQTPNAKQFTPWGTEGALSMGMSADYKTAIECGSNMIRIGSMLFGERNYNH
ncbi:MAG: YggS family pyridoxal phosphate-dependent enzyme [Bacteroidota bacterium]